MVLALEVIHEPLIVASENAIFLLTICMEENDIVLMSLLFFKMMKPT